MNDGWLVGAPTVQAPTNAIQFQATCNALRRNDCAVNRFTNKFLYDQQEYSDVDGYGRPLGDSLLQGNNSVVSLLELNLSGFLTHMEKRRFDDGDIQNDSHPFLQWIRQARKLRTVNLYVGSASDSANVSRSDQVNHVRLQQHILIAMSQNPSICEFESTAENFPNERYVNYINSAREWLTSLKLIVSGDDNLEAVARAIGAVPNLQVLRLDAWHPELFLDHLQATTTLRSLAMSFKHHTAHHAGSIQSLCNIWRNNSKQLQSVTLTDRDLHTDDWEHIESALRYANSIEHLVLLRCTLYHFYEKFRTFFKWYNAPVQPVRFLTLNSCRSVDPDPWARGFPIPGHQDVSPPDNCPGKETADMLCGSRLQHFELNVDDNVGTLARAHVPGFFSGLRPWQVRLQSMKLTGVDNGVLDHLSTFLPEVHHLRELIVEPGVYRVDWSGHEARAMFLSAVRRNGRLHKIIFADLPAELERRVSAYTERNRCLPKLMANLGPNIKKDNASANTPGQIVLDSEPDKPQQQEPRKTIDTKFFPVLSCAALNVKRMEYKMVFLGLLAVRDKTTTTESLTDKKRRL